MIRHPASFPPASFLPASFLHGRAWAAFLFVGLAASAAHSQVLVTHRDLSGAGARIIAERALACAEGHGWQVSVTVLGRDGQEMAYLRSTDANPHTYDNSHRKAFTARTFRSTSAEFGAAIAKNPGRAAQALLPDVTTAAGGVPIMAGAEVIGGIGVSGSPGGENDELCAREGISAVAEQLK